MFCFMMLYPACRDIFQCIIFQIVQMCIIYYKIVNNRSSVSAISPSSSCIQAKLYTDVIVFIVN